VELAVLLHMTSQALGRTSPGAPERQTVLASLQNISKARLSMKSTGLAAARWSRGQLLGSRRRGWRESWPGAAAFEDGDGALGIADPGAHKVRPQRGRRDLQVATAKATQLSLPKRIRKWLAPNRDFSSFVL
jgi:hypothetical protein